MLNSQFFEKWRWWLVVGLMLTAAIVACGADDPAPTRDIPTRTPVRAAPTAAPKTTCPNAGERAYFVKVEPLVKDVTEGAIMVRLQRQNIGNNPHLLYDQPWRDAIQRIANKTRNGYTGIRTENVPASLQDIHDHYRKGGKHAVDAVDLFSTSLDTLDSATLLQSVAQSEQAQAWINEAGAKKRAFCK